MSEAADRLELALDPDKNDGWTRLMDGDDGTSEIDDLRAVLAEAREAESQRQQATVPESIRATALETAQKLIPAPKVSQYVGQWPKDERDLYRDTDWRSFTERGEALDRLRIYKAAVAVVDAVLPAVVAQVRHDTLVEIASQAESNELPPKGVLDEYLTAQREVVVAQVQADTLEEAARIVEDAHGGTHESQRESFAAALRKRAAEYREKGDNHE